MKCNEFYCRISRISVNRPILLCPFPKWRKRERKNEVIHDKSDTCVVKRCRVVRMLICSSSLLEGVIFETRVEKRHVVRKKKKQNKTARISGVLLHFWNTKRGWIWREFDRRKFFYEYAMMISRFCVRALAFLRNSCRRTDLTVKLEKHFPSLNTRWGNKILIALRNVLRWL